MSTDPDLTCCNHSKSCNDNNRQCDILEIHLKASILRKETLPRTCLTKQVLADITFKFITHILKLKSIKLNNLVSTGSDNSTFQSYFRLFFCSLCKTTSCLVFTHSVDTDMAIN